MGTSYAEAVAGRRLALPPSIQAMAGWLAGWLAAPGSLFSHSLAFAHSPRFLAGISPPPPPARSAPSLRRPSGTKYPFTKQRKTVTCEGGREQRFRWSKLRKRPRTWMHWQGDCPLFWHVGLGMEKAPLWPGPPQCRRLDLDVMFGRAAKL